MVIRALQASMSIRICNYNCQATSFGSSFDCIFSNGNGFISARPFFRYWWYTSKQLAYDNVEDYGFNGLRSESNRVLGIRLFIGGSRFSRIKKEHKEAWGYL